MAINFTSITKVINEASQWAGLLSGLFEKAPKEVKEKLPMFLGLSLEDERRWGKLWAKLDETDKGDLTDFLEACKDYERNHFRYVVVGVPFDTKTEKISKGKGSEKEVVIPHIDYAFEFLKNLAATIRDKGADEARRQCLMGGIVIADPFSQKVIEKWKEAINWCEKNILEMLEVESFSEITSEKVLSGLKKIDNSIASRIPVSTAGRSSKNLLQVTEDDMKTPGLIETIFGFKFKL